VVKEKRLKGGVEVLIFNQRGKIAESAEQRKDGRKDK